MHPHIKVNFDADFYGPKSYADKEYNLKVKHKITGDVYSIDCKGTSFPIFFKTLSGLAVELFENHNVLASDMELLSIDYGSIKGIT